MTVIAYYITSHGFGHATRTCALIRELFSLHDQRRRERAVADELFIHIVGDLPGWLFDDLSPWSRSLRFRRHRLDFGLAQKDGVRVDQTATEELLRGYLLGFDDLAREEAAFLREAGVSIVLSDIPALPFVSAELAGVPAIGVSNFSWDFIYRAYSAGSALFEEAIARFEDAYQKASLLLRLPFAPKMELFPMREDIPLLVRHARRSKAEVKEELGLGQDPRPIALLSFGGFGLKDFDAAELDRHDEIVFLVFGISAKTVPPNVRMMPDGRWFFPDLVEAADVIVSKPGYSMVSEAIAHQRAVLYTPRDDFPEARYLVRGLEAHVPTRRIELEALISGELAKSIALLLESKDYHPIDRTDGAAVAAKRILTL